MSQAINITDTEIHINGFSFIDNNFLFKDKELFFDIFSNYYKSQKIIISSFDGENLRLSGMLDFISYLSDIFEIPEQDITYTNFRLSIFKNTHTQLSTEFNLNLDKAKFVGTTIGRFNATRLRLVYAIDKTFPNDNFTIFQPSIDVIKHGYTSAADLYINELTWISTKQFDTDIQHTYYTGGIDWQYSCNHYHNIWNKFLIEIVSETDAFSNQWFTEKTARCLATGKPFLLIAGPLSLKTLQDMKFKTFHSVIDENYDKEKTPTFRINKAIESLKQLYNSSDREQRIKELYSIAKENIKIYKDLINAN